MFLPKWCAHCIVTNAAAPLQSKNRALPVANDLPKLNKNNQRSGRRHRSAYLFSRRRYQGIGSASSSSSETSTNDSNPEIIHLKRSVRIKQGTCDPRKPIRPSVMQVNGYTNCNGYQLKSWLGSGGFGRVYSAVRVGDKLPVAIKYINKWKVVDWEEVNGVKVPLEYALLLTAETVPGVVRALDCYNVGKDHVAIVTELLEPCRDLYDVLVQEGPLPVSFARHYFRQIVRAVVGCYSLGVLHRDIKAENVVVHLKTHQVKLIDFGCGAYGEQSKLYDRLIGTRDYYAPEMLAASGPRYRADEVAVWSLGVLLFAMVCGELPFKTKRHALAAYYEYPSRTTADWGCVDLINQLLKKVPNHRRRLEDIPCHPWLASAADTKLPIQQRRR